MDYEQLKLSNQICFPFYAVSRLITREYQPYLEKMGITYPQYLVLLVLWEDERISVNEIAQKLILNTNTVTPLLKRMESEGILSRNRSGTDERKVMVTLTEKGKAMQAEAAEIPEKLFNSMSSGQMDISDLIDLRNKLNELIAIFSEGDK